MKFHNKKAHFKNSNFHVYLYMKSQKKFLKKKLFQIVITEKFF